MNLSDKIQSGHYGKRSLVCGARGSWAALAVGAVGAIGAGVGAYSSAQSKQNATSGLANAGYAVPQYGKTIDYLNGNWASPNYENYTPTSNSAGYQDFLGQGKYTGQTEKMLNKITNKENSQYRKNLSKYTPSLIGDIGTYAANNSALVNGQIPADVLGQVQRGDAEGALFNGFGDSGMSRNLTARDLGLTSLQLMQQGGNNLAGIEGLSSSLNPVKASALNYLTTPTQFLQSDISQNQYGTNVYNQNQTNSTQNANQRAQLIASLMGQQAQANATGTNTQNLLQYQANLAPNPWISGLSTGAGALASSYGGGMGSSLGAGSAGGSAASLGANYSASPNGGWATQGGGYFNPNV
jgi:hypothetical protein